MKKIVLVLLVSVAFARELPRVDPRLKEVHSVFVSGNNQAAEKILLLMANESEKGKTCLAIVTIAGQAGTKLEVAADSTMIRGRSPMSREREWTINGTLTTKSGDMIWSAHSQSSDATFASGVDTVAKGLYRRLKLDVYEKQLAAALQE